MSSKTITLFLTSLFSVFIFGCTKDAFQAEFAAAAIIAYKCDGGLDGGADGGCENAPVVAPVPACEAEENDPTTITLYCRPNLKNCGSDKPGRWKNDMTSIEVAMKYLVPLLEKTPAIVRRGPFTSYVFPGKPGEIEYSTERSHDTTGTTYKEIYIRFYPRVVTKASPDAQVQADDCVTEALDIISNPWRGPFELISETVEKAMNDLAQTNNDSDGNLYRRMKCTFYPSNL